MRHSLIVVFAVLALLSLVEANPAAAARYRVRDCHWGYSNNCEFLSYRQCVQLNIWAELLCSCTPPLAARTHGTRRARQ
jgi:Protein of unknown function (DUF3551)